MFDVYARRFGVPRTDVERVMAHYGVSREEAERMIAEKGVERLLPPRGARVMATPMTFQGGSSGWLLLGVLLGALVLGIVGFIYFVRK